MSEQAEAEISTIFNDEGISLAFSQTPGLSPGVIFLGGFKSDMQGIKATSLEQWCRMHDRAFIRFDYSGHGQSGDSFENGTISRWLADTLLILDQVASGPQILVGSSMGGWLMLRAAIERKTRICGLLGIASAADFTEILFHQRLDATEQSRLMAEGRIERPSDYDAAPYIYTRDLIEDGKNNLLLKTTIELDVPIRLIHSIDDPDVPWEVSRSILQQYRGADARLNLLKDAGHRLSRESDISLTLETLGQLIATVTAKIELKND